MIKLYILFLIYAGNYGNLTSRTNLGGVSHKFVRILLVASVEKSDSYAHTIKFPFFTVCQCINSLVKQEFKMSIKGYGTGHRTKERIGKFINPKSRSQNVRYTEELDLLTLPLFGTDPDRNRVTWETPSSELIPCRRKPLRRTRLLRGPAQTQVWSEQVWLNTTFISQRWKPKGLRRN